MDTIQLFPSLFAAPQLQLAETINRLDAHVDGFHIDIMDLHFANNLAFNFLTVRELQQHTNNQLFFHLMVEHPGLVAERLTIRQDDIIVHHVENKVNHEHVLGVGARYGARVGLAINPATDITQLKPHLDQIQIILVMGVNPGFSGQQPALDLSERVAQIRKLIGTHPIEIAVDGGVNGHTIRQLTQAGAQIFCAGSIIFSADDWIRAIAELRKKAAE